MMGRRTLRIDDNRQKRTRGLQARLDGFMPAVPARLHFPESILLKYIELIGLLLGEFRKANQKILAANFASIPNMVDDTFASPELNQAYGAMGPMDILPLNGFSTMSFEFMHSKGLLGPKRSSTQVTDMTFAEGGNSRSGSPLSNNIGELKRASFNDKFGKGFLIISGILTPIAERPLSTTRKVRKKGKPSQVLENGRRPRLREITGRLQHNK